jgi:mono/diheme cytochrome c family protein
MKIVALASLLTILPAGFAVAADAAAGKAVYDKSCKSCHGAAGVANPAVAKMMKVEIKDLNAADVQAMSAADMKKIIAEGKGKMKPVKSVAGKDIDNVVSYVRSLKK